MRLLIFLISSLLLAQHLNAQDLSLILKAKTRSTIVGLPLRLDLLLQGIGKFELSQSFGDCDGHTHLIVRDIYGNTVKPATQIPCESNTPDFPGVGFEYVGQAKTHFEIYLIPGKYRISATYLSSETGMSSEVSVRGGKEIWTGSLRSAELDVEVLEPTGDDLNAFTRFVPSGGATSPESYTTFLNEHGSEILAEYPKSNYSAYMLWQSGLSFYEQMADQGIEEDLQYHNRLEQMYGQNSRGLERAKQEPFLLIDPWERLYKDFPNFNYREDVLLGLTKAYFRLGKPEKTRSFVKELNEKFSHTPQAAKVQSYKALLEKENLWIQ